MSDYRYFHFTIGPVQGFVSQARRTRDFWAGSFILSWLSGVAMQATLAQGEKDQIEILFPEVNQEYLSWIKGKPLGKRPRQGSIPNRFKAQVPSSFTSQDAKQVVKSINDAWKALAKIIYNKDIKDVVADNYPETRTIWNRQIKSFWEISWAITDAKDDSSILDRRKNWRSYFPPEEKGVKCMMMDGWQELSGVESPHAEKLKAFWEQIRENRSKAMKSDLYEGESLCAMALVKRRFVHYFKDLQVEMEGVQPWIAKGWGLESGIPSVSYLAAVHTLEKIANQAKTDKKVEQNLYNFQTKAYELTKDRGEWDTNINCINKLIDNKEDKRWASLDGNVYFESVLLNKKLYPEQKKAESVIKALNKLGNKPSPFYAVLMMDGDSLGEKMSVLDNQDTISKALGEFTENTVEIVNKNNGFLIYAGGDDVLAILPLEDAIKCAKELRDDYLDCFAQNNGERIGTTLSGAIEYAHIKMPLTKVLHDAHDLLDNIAKEQTGRDALAIRVWKPGGEAIEWAQPWKTVLEGDNSQTRIDTLVEQFQKADSKDSTFSNKFFFKIRERFDLLNPTKEKPNDPILSKSEAISLMAMEYLNTSSVISKKLNMGKAEKLVEPLLTLCRPHTRKDNKITASKRIEADGALLVRFLAQKGEKQ